MEPSGSESSSVPRGVPYRRIMQHMHVDPKQIASGQLEPYEAHFEYNNRTLAHHKHALPNELAGVQGFNRAELTPCTNGTCQLPNCTNAVHTLEMVPEVAEKPAKTVKELILAGGRQPIPTKGVLVLPTVILPIDDDDDDEQYEDALEEQLEDDPFEEQYITVPKKKKKPNGLKSLLTKSTRSNTERKAMKRVHFSMDMEDTHIDAWAADESKPSAASSDCAQTVNITTTITTTTTTVSSKSPLMTSPQTSTSSTAPAPFPQKRYYTPRAKRRSLPPTAFFSYSSQIGSLCSVQLTDVEASTSTADISTEPLPHGTGQSEVELPPPPPPQSEPTDSATNYIEIEDDDDDEVVFLEELVPTNPPEPQAEDDVPSDEMNVDGQMDSAPMGIASMALTSMANAVIANAVMANARLANARKAKANASMEPARVVPSHRIDPSEAPASIALATLANATLSNTAQFKKKIRIEVGGVPKIRCRVEDCPVIMDTEREVCEHLIGHVRLYKCSVCEALYTTKQGVFRHFRLHQV